MKIIIAVNSFLNLITAPALSPPGADCSCNVKERGANSVACASSAAAIPSSTTSLKRLRRAASFWSLAKSTLPTRNPITKDLLDDEVAAPPPLPNDEAVAPLPPQGASGDGAVAMALETAGVPPGLTTPGIASMRFRTSWSIASPLPFSCAMSFAAAKTFSNGRNIIDVSANKPPPLRLRLKLVFNARGGSFEPCESRAVAMPPSTAAVKRVAPRSSTLLT